MPRCTFMNENSPNMGSIIFRPPFQIDGCFPFGMEPNIGVYAIHKCPNNYTGPDIMRSKCQFYDDSTDPLLSAFVTDTTTQVTYKNRYCAECNDAPPTSMVYWEVILFCEKGGSNLRIADVWGNIEYRSNVRRWGIAIRDRFYQCDFFFDAPRSLLPSVKKCRLESYVYCPKEKDIYSFRQMCLSCENDIEDRMKDRFYSCLYCRLFRDHSRFCEQNIMFIGNKRPVYSFVNFIYEGSIPGKIIKNDQKVTCIEGEIYDKFFRQCRNVKCIFPSYSLIDNKCIKEY